MKNGVCGILVLVTCGLASYFFVSRAPAPVLSHEGKSPVRQQALIFEPTGQISNPDAGDVKVGVPIRMNVIREFPVESAWPTALSNLRVFASCGCASAKIIPNNLEPGAKGVLQCQFDGKKTAGRQVINLRVASPDAPGATFTLRLVIEQTHGIASIVSCIPAKVNLDGVWGPQSEETVTVSIVSPEGSLSGVSFVAETSSNLIQVADLSDTQEGGKRLTLRVSGFPVGEFDESVRIHAAIDSEDYELTVPVSISVSPWLQVEPRYINLECETDREREIVLRGLPQNLKTPPVVVAKGQCSVGPLRKTSDSEWRAVVTAKTSGGERICYGLVEISGGWPGKPITVPVSTITAAKQTTRSE